MLFIVNLNVFQVGKHPFHDAAASTSTTTQESPKESEDDYNDIPRKNERRRNESPYELERPYEKPLHIIHTITFLKLKKLTMGRLSILQTQQLGRAYIGQCGYDDASDKTTYKA